VLKKVMSIFLAIIFVSSVLSGCSAGNNNATTEKKDRNEGEVQTLQVFSGAGLRKPMDEIGKVFEEKYGVKVEYAYAGSAQNLSQIELTGKGDVYVPGAMYYYESAKEKGLVDEKKDVAYHIPVIGVPKGNPANIKTLEDLGKDNVKVVLGDEKSAAIGKQAKKILTENNLQEAVAKNTVVKAATVNELVVYLTMKQADASIVWEDNIAGVEDVEIIEIAKDKNEIKTIPVCIISKSNKKELANQFVDFVTSSEGKSYLKKHGFKTLE